jgi:hypothetical protein
VGSALADEVLDVAADEMYLSGLLDLLITRSAAIPDTHPRQAEFAIYI